MAQKTYPPVIRDTGAISVPFSPFWHIRKVQVNDKGDYHYKDDIYRKLGYDV